MPEVSAHTTDDASLDRHELGIDRKHLVDLRKRFLTVNDKRLVRTRAALQPRQSLILDLLPLLFHVNHPLLPGYVGQDAPAGVATFKPDKALLREARRLSRGFRYQPLSARQQAIHGIYVMGSVGTIGQSRGSDLDIWVCHDSDLKSNALQKLQSKCTRISDWCREQSLEVCFFPMDAEKFSRGATVPLSEESSGSAQHSLLLDEFYRSAIYLGGRYPLWWFVPVSQEHNYDHYVRELLEKRFLARNSVVDLGIPRIPPAEFITAAIWQLYKGIYSPYKSLLKLMLLETYAATYPARMLLSSQFKQRVQEGCTDINRLDPYLLAYEAIEQHLNASTNPERRLELLRRCLYFKVNKPLSQRPRTSPPSWQRIELQSRVATWGWDEGDIQRLDQRRHWKTSEVSAERKLLVQELLYSYRELSGLVATDVAKRRAIHEEIAILGRKLSAAFERKAGKVEWINPDISPDLSESYLTLQKQRQGNNNRWQLLEKPPLQAGEAGAQPPLRIGFSPLELFVWAYCNEILTDHTHSWLQTGLNQNYKLHSLHKALMRWLPMPVASSEHAAFQHKPCARSLMLVINLLQPSTQAQVGADIELDPLNVGRDGDSLVNDTHVIIHNSWNEVFVQSYEKLGLESMLTEYLRQSLAAPQSRAPRLTVFCRDGALSAQLRNRVEQLAQQLGCALVSARGTHANRFILANNGHYSCWQVSRGKPIVHQLGDEEQLLRFLAQPQERPSRICTDQHTLAHHPLVAMANLPPSTAIQVGYRVDNQRAELLVLDEKGSLFHCSCLYHSEATLLRPLHRFLRNTIARQGLTTDGSHFIGVYPIEFYRLVKEAPESRYVAAQRPVVKDIEDLPFFDIQVIIELDPFEQMRYAIYCDDRQFLEVEFGPHLFREVAAFILSHRHRRERYPCYITDLDVSRCEYQVAGGQALQICHYLQIKHDIESRLHRELLKL